jgi:hypothetical protein
MYKKFPTTLTKQFVTMRTSYLLQTTKSHVCSRPLYKDGIVRQLSANTRGRILGRNWDKEFSSLPVTSTNAFYPPPPPPPSKSGLKLVCNIYI